MVINRYFTTKSFCFGTFRILIEGDESQKERIDQGYIRHAYIYTCDAGTAGRIS